MPQSRRYKKKKSAGKAILAWIIVLAILAAGVFVFVSVFYEDAKKKLDEMNYPCQKSPFLHFFSFYIALIGASYHLIRLLIASAAFCVASSTCSIEKLFSMTMSL